jgi:hypothetical protein
MIYMSKARNTKNFTPLFIVTAFLAVTELVAGYVATQTWGFLQGVLVFFLVFFPVLVGGAFFLILWSRPHIFFPPSGHDPEIEEV